MRRCWTNSCRRPTWWWTAATTSPPAAINRACFAHGKPLCPARRSASTAGERVRPRRATARATHACSRPTSPSRKRAAPPWACSRPGGDHRRHAGLGGAAPARGRGDFAGRPAADAGRPRGMERDARAARPACTVRRAQRLKAQGSRPSSADHRPADGGVPPPSALRPRGLAHATSAAATRVPKKTIADWTTIFMGGGDGNRLPPKPVFQPVIPPQSACCCPARPRAHPVAR